MKLVLLKNKHKQTVQVTKICPHIAGRRLCSLTEEFLRDFQLCCVLWLSVKYILKDLSQITFAYYHKH